MAEESFWNDIIGMTGVGTVSGLSRFLEPEIWSRLSACALAFLSSNEYQQDPDPHAPRWNFVERFLALRSKTLQSDEKGVLGALRNSHMSIYRVIRIEPDNSLHLWDMISDINVQAQGNSDLVRGLKPKDVSGMRILEIAGIRRIMDDTLPLASWTATNLASDLKKIHTKLLRRLKNDPDAKEELGNASDQEILHLARVMWAPEIATAYVGDKIPALSAANRM